jgi:BirA family biotin operon repressor/biotin-[acetyl-CoA-carboxylase] ligase
MGLSIPSIKGVGYQLSRPLELLDAERITKYLQKGEAAHLVANIKTHWSVTSTNDELAAIIKKNDQMTSGSVVLAEHQSAGRGRRGKQWISPLGGSLYFSIAWRFDKGAESLEGLSLSMAMAVIAALEPQVPKQMLKIKWPNDIYLNGKKLGGILIDVTGEADGPCWAVVGVGLNIYQDDASMHSVDQPWTVLSSSVDSPIRRNALAASLIAKIVGALNAYEKNGFAISPKTWQQYDAFHEKSVVVKQGEQIFFTGISKGISESGGIIVEVDGVQKVIKSGEVSLRCAE